MGLLGVAHPVGPVQGLRQRPRHALVGNGRQIPVRLGRGAQPFGRDIQAQEVLPDGDDQVGDGVRATEPADGVAFAQEGAFGTHHRVVDVEEIEQDLAECGHRFRGGDRIGKERAELLNRGITVLKQPAFLVGQPLQLLLDLLLVVFGQPIALTTLAGQHAACVEREADHLAKRGEAVVRGRGRHGKRCRPRGRPRAAGSLLAVPVELLAPVAIYRVVARLVPGVPWFGLRWLL